MVKMVKMSKNCKHFNFEAATHEAESRQGLHFRIPLLPLFWDHSWQILNSKLWIGSSIRYWKEWDMKHGLWEDPARGPPSIHPSMLLHKLQSI